MAPTELERQAFSMMAHLQERVPLLCVRPLEEHLGEWPRSTAQWERLAREELQ